MRRGRSIERIIYGKNGPSCQGFLSSSLHVISSVYGLGVRARLFLYGTGILEGSRLPCKVISVGNITLGGTGKTPTVEYIARLLKDEGKGAVILSRGYGGEMERKLGLVSDGNRLLLSLDQAGDEPYMMAKRLQGTPIVVGRRRDLTGQYAIEHFHPDVIILDDGFQHLGIRRDVDILLVDSQVGFGNGSLFPRGPLREPLPQLGRADIFLMTKVEDLDACRELEERIQSHKKDPVIFHSNYRPDHLTDLNRDERLPVEYIKGRRIAAVSAIANPGYFRHLLELVGARLEEEITFPDHYVYSGMDIPTLRGAMRRAECIVTTEKDGAKLRGLIEEDLHIVSLGISLNIMEEDQFKRTLLDMLGEQLK